MAEGRIPKAQRPIMAKVTETQPIEPDPVSLPKPRLRDAWLPHGEQQTR